MRESFSSREGRIGQGFRSWRRAAEKPWRMSGLPGGDLFRGLRRQIASRHVPFKINALIESGGVDAPVFPLLFTGGARLALAPLRLRPILALTGPGRVI